MNDRLHIQRIRNAIKKLAVARNYHAQVARLVKGSRAGIGIGGESRQRPDAHERRREGGSMTKVCKCPMPAACPSSARAGTRGNVRGSRPNR
jgi:hypothetical protein